MRRQMNLYLVLAIALGAVSGAGDVRIERASAHVVAANQVGVQREVPLAARCSPLAVTLTGDPRPSLRVPRTESPLTGAATPRAPALS